MKKLVPFALAFAVFATPLFAAKKQTVNIPYAVTVGSTQIPAGEYKVSYQGSTPTVTVTLARSGSSPIILDATLAAAVNGARGITFSNVGSVRALRNIELSDVTLVFETPQPGDR